MKIRAYIYHKRAEKYTDCQDCFGIDANTRRIAISDGMSQSIFPQWWAKILVDAYLETGHIPDDISPLQYEWQQQLVGEIQKREEEAKSNPKRNPWRLKNAISEKAGAGATLCGLTLADKGWTCECIGDSCLIAVNRDYTLNFYTSQVGAFGNQPDYLDSFQDGRGTPKKESIKQDVVCLLMVSDPFAELFQNNETNLEFIKSRLAELQNLSDHESFKQLVEKWRDEFSMHNDDSTLILIEDLSDSTIHADHIDNLAELCSKETCLEVEQKKPDSWRENVSANGVENTPPEGRKDKEARALNKKEAETQFVCAVKNLLTYYSGKRQKDDMRKWIVNQYLKRVIDSIRKK